MEPLLCWKQNSYYNEIDLLEELLDFTNGLCAIKLSSYRRINSTKSPAAGAGNGIEPTLMQQARRVREVVCAYINQCVQSKAPGLVCLRSSCNHVTEVGGP